MTKHVTKWYPSRNGWTFGSGSTLTTTAGTFTSSGATLSLTKTSLTVTGGATVGTTLDSADDFNAGVVTIDAANGNMATGNATTGTLTCGVPANGYAIILDPSGTPATPAAHNIQLTTDGSDIFARRNDGGTEKLSTAWSASGV